MQIQEEEKVTIMRARQILEKNNEFTERPARPFYTHFDCKMNENDKRKVTPWLLEKCLEQQLKAKPKTIRTSSKTTFTVEVANKEESTAMQKVKDINGMSVEVSVNTALEVNKGLVNIYGYNTGNFEAFKAGLAEQYGLSSVVKATWIKQRRGNNAKPLLLTFPNELPQYLNNPGEISSAQDSTCLTHGYSFSCFYSDYLLLVPILNAPPTTCFMAFFTMKTLHFFAATILLNVSVCSTLATPMFFLALVLTMPVYQTPLTHQRSPLVL